MQQLLKIVPAWIEFIEVKSYLGVPDLEVNLGVPWRVYWNHNEFDIRSKTYLALPVDQRFSMFNAQDTEIKLKQ